MFNPNPNPPPAEYAPSHSCKLQKKLTDVQGKPSRTASFTAFFAEIGVFMGSSRFVMSLEFQIDSTSIEWEPRNFDCLSFSKASVR